MKKNNILTIVITIFSFLLVILITVFLTKYFSQKNLTISLKPKATLAGKITYSGLIPEASDTEVVKVMIRPLGSNDEYKDTSVRVDLVENAPWSYEDAYLGQNYEVRAVLTRDGQTLKMSNVETVTAPAININLDFNVNWEDLGLSPEQVASETISGEIQINGYIPPNSYVNIIETGIDAEEKTILQLGATSDILRFNHTEIVPINDYILSADLVNANGETIGTSSRRVQANVGDHKVKLVINSTATAPVKATPAPVVHQQPTTSPPPQASNNNASISGSVIINGPLDDNSRVIIRGRLANQGDYKVWQILDNPNNNGQGWTYNQLVAGESYDVQAVLQVRQSDVNQSNVQTVAAPAKNLNFTVNTGINLNAPTQTVVVDPCQRDGERWQTVVKVPVINEAGQYLVQIGTKPGYSDVYNQIFTAPADNQPLVFNIGNFESNKKYYIRYAYSECHGCTNSANFSGWNQTIDFTCQ